MLQCNDLPSVVVLAQGIANTRHEHENEHTQLDDGEDDADGGSDGRDCQHRSNCNAQHEAEWGWLQQ